MQCRANRDTCTLRASLLNEGRRKEPLKFTWLNRAQHPLQPLSNFISNQPDLGFVDQLEHGIGVHELDVDAARNILAHHHIAQQREADCRLRLDSAGDQWRIAGPQDSVRRHVLIEFLLHRGRDIDVSEDAKAFSL